MSIRQNDLHAIKKVYHDKLAFVMIRLYINIKLFIESCLPKGFSYQLNEAFAQIYWYDVNTNSCW